MQRLFASVVCFTLCALIANAGAGGLKVDGNWAVTGLTYGGKKIPDEALENLKPTFMFKDGKYSAAVEGKQDEAGSFSIDAKKKPAQIDLMITEGKDKGKTQLGLIKVDGDVLTMALAKPGSKDRPKDFDGGEGLVVATLKRGK